MKNFSKVFMLAFVVSSPAFAAVGAADVVKKGAEVVTTVVAELPKVVSTVVAELPKTDVATPVVEAAKTGYFKSFTNKAVEAKDAVVTKSTDAANWVKGTSVVQWIGENPYKSAGITAAVAVAAYYYFYVYKAQEAKKDGAYHPSYNN